MAAVVLSESKKKKLVEHMVNRRLWHVKDDYVKHRKVRELTILRTGDTALHVAASDQVSWQYYAEEMVSAAGPGELAIGNVQGDTALHVAAKCGSTFFCRCIAQKDVTLVGEKNESGETPLFSAVSRGHTKAFLYLHHLCKDKASEILDKPETYTRNDGDTILHSAIFEERYDLAYIIILKCPELAQQPNNNGLLPLHVLATKPEAFPSGLHSSRIRKLINFCEYIGDLAKKLDVDKPPNPRLGWDAIFGPLEAGVRPFPCLILLLSIKENLRRVSCLIDYGEIDQEDEEAANEQDHGEINQEDEEAANVQVKLPRLNLSPAVQKVTETREEDGGAASILDHGEINQEDEAAANVQDDRTIQSWIRHSLRKIMLGCYYLLIHPVVIIVLLICALCILLGSWCFVTLIWIAIVLVKKFSGGPAIQSWIRPMLGYLLLLPVASPIIIVLLTCSLCVGLCISLGLWCFVTLIRIAIVLVMKFSGYNEYVRVKHLKETYEWSVKVMNNLIESYEKSPAQEHQSMESTSKVVEKPIFNAAKHGISEMVLRILDGKPEEIYEVNAEKKNIVMLAVEHRHNHLYNDLMNYGRINKTVLEQVDKNGNNLLHIAANLKAGQQFWRIRGAALHMHMEIKWYEYVKKSMPTHLVQGRNKKKQTPKEILQYSHKNLIKEGRQWLTDTSQSCSLVAALIATVSFAASATVPGGLKQDTGVPSLEHRPIFIASAISALVALSSSMVSVVMFLSILTSSFKLQDFRRDLPFKLLWGLVSLLISIFSMIISFFAGHYFVLKQEFNHQAALVYEIVCSILVALILYTFPLEFEIVRSTISTTPTK